MAPENQDLLTNCQEAFGLDVPITKERATEIAASLEEVLKNQKDRLPLELLAEQDPSLAEFFTDQPIDESVFSHALRVYIDEDPRIVSIQKAIDNTKRRDYSRASAGSNQSSSMVVTNTQALRQKGWLTRQLVVFELIRDCPQLNGGVESLDDALDESEVDYEDAG